MNTKRSRNNINQEDEQIVREVIRALGQIGHPQGRGPLDLVSASNWPPAVVILANEAIEKIKR
ncbi:MAG: hypothetical protein LBG95_01200 [Treponema sp.]|nr:hypothetical protein [Treponema sp.]